MKSVNYSALALAFLTLTSCSKLMNRNSPAANAAKSQSEAEAKLCDNMTQKGGAIRQYPTVTQETSLSAVKEANIKVEDAVNELQKSSGKINSPDLLEVTTKYQELQSTVSSVPGGRETVGSAADQISTQAGQLQTAWNHLYKKMQCGA